jgi:hypothetical protein
VEVGARGRSGDPTGDHVEVGERDGAASRPGGGGKGGPPYGRRCAPLRPLGRPARRSWLGTRRRARRDRGRGDTPVRPPLCPPLPCASGVDGRGQGRGGVRPLALPRHSRRGLPGAPRAPRLPAPLAALPPAPALRATGGAGVPGDLLTLRGRGTAPAGRLVAHRGGKGGGLGRGASEGEPTASAGKSPLSSAGEQRWGAPTPRLAYSGTVRIASRTSSSPTER